MEKERQQVVNFFESELFIISLSLFINHLMINSSFCTLTFQSGPFEIWTKAMGLDEKSMAFAFLNLDDAGGPIPVCSFLCNTVEPVLKAPQNKDRL